MDQNTVSKAEQDGITFEELMVYARKILKRWWIVVLAAVLLSVAGFVVAKLTYVPQYSSQIMFVASNKDQSLVVSGQSSSDLLASMNLAENYKYVFTSKSLTAKVANNCGYKVTAEQVKKFISVQAVEDTAIVYLTVTTTDPEVSSAIANTYMRFYEEAIAEAFPSTTLKAIDPPLLPETPDADNSVMRFTLLGFFGGAVLAVMVLVFVIFMQDPVMSAEDIRSKVGLKIIGSVNHVVKKIKKGEKQSILLTDRRAGFSFIETFKMIRTKLEHMLLRKGQKALIVTSTGENEGKTTVSINIALALAKNGKEVLLIDGDLRKPAVAKALGINAADDVGVLGVVNGSKTLAESIKYSEKYNLYLLLSGKGIPDPSEVLSTEQMEEIIASAKREFDYVIIDTSPCGVVADASILAGFADAIVMVVRQDTVPIRRIRRALENLDNSGTEIIGCIYNDAKTGFSDRVISRRYGYGESYGYESGYGRSASKK